MGVWAYRNTVVVAVALVGCRIDSVDLTGKACPCPSDWTCDPQTQTCTRSITPVDAPDPPVDTLIDAAPDPNRELAFWFRLDETSGQVVSNAVPGGQPGYAVDALSLTWTTGQVGGGLHFDGTAYASFVPFPSTTVVCDGTFSLTGSFTASAWVRFESFQAWNSYSLSDVAMMQGTNGGTEGGWGLGATDGCGVSTAAVTITTPAQTRATRCGTTALQTNVWYLLTGVYDASARTLEIYVNGIKENGPMTPSSAAIPTSLHPTNAECPYLGASANQSQLLRGTLDNVRLYTRALSAQDIAQLHANGG